MTSWLLILYIGTNQNGTPQFIVKPFESEMQCIRYAGEKEALERLNDNYGCWSSCIERTK